MARQASKTAASKNRWQSRSNPANAEAQTSASEVKSSTSEPKKRAQKAKAAATVESSEHSPLPSGFRMMKVALAAVLSHWKLFLGILAVYALLNLVFVQTIASLDATNVKASLDQLFTSSGDKLTAATAFFSYLVGASIRTSTSGGDAYQLVFLIVVSLAFIRALREVYDGHLPRIRDAYYTGMFPLVPFACVLAVLAIQLVPMTLGASIYSSMTTYGIAINVREQLIWGAVFLALSLVSLYLITSSIIALYITTQPDMTPMRALRGGKKVTHGRRWSVLGKLLFLIAFLIIGSAVIVIPIILAVPAAAAASAFALMVLGLGIVHSYMFVLLRSVLA